MCPDSKWALGGIWAAAGFHQEDTFWKLWVRGWLGQEHFFNGPPVRLLAHSATRGPLWIRLRVLLVALLCPSTTRGPLRIWLVGRWGQRPDSKCVLGSASGSKCRPPWMRIPGEGEQGVLGGFGQSWEQLAIKMRQSFCTCLLSLSKNQSFQRPWNSKWALECILGPELPPGGHCGHDWTWRVRGWLGADQILSGPKVKTPCHSVPFPTHAFRVQTWRA